MVPHCIVILLLFFLDIVRSDPCHKGICNNGICFAQNSSNVTDSRYTCFCRNGFTGLNCEINYNDCDNVQCNNGTCLDAIDAFFCQCPVGFEGKHCEKNVDDCTSSPCQNGATCIDLVNNYSCNCADGFSGTNCETDLRPCQLDCKNGGSCLRDGAAFVCSCSLGFAGNQCEVTIDYCQSSPCLNGGHCESFIGHYHCRCPLRWAGDHCEHKMAECTDNVCLNGYCMTNGTSLGDQDHELIICYCKPDYHGDRCQFKYDDCASSPCQNGATCDDGTNSYGCQCSENFAGRDCEIDCGLSPHSVLCMSRSTTTTESSTLPEPEVNTISENNFTQSATGLPATTLTDMSLILNSTETTTSPDNDTNNVTMETESNMNLTESTATEMSSPEVSSNDTKEILYNLKFAQDNSYLTIPVNVTDQSTLSIGFMIKINQSGLIMSSSHHSLQLTLTVDNRTLHLNILITDRNVSLSTVIDDTDDQFHRVELSTSSDLNSSQLVLTLAVDETKKFSTRLWLGHTTGHLALDSLTFGHSRTLAEPMTPFRGCLKQIRVNGRRRFSSDDDAIYGNLTECNQDVCLDEPCGQGGKCSAANESSTTGFRCNCVPGFEGPFCQTVTCTPNGPCQNGGACMVMGHQDYRCLCANGWLGSTCHTKWKSDNSTTVSPLAYNGIDSFSGFTLSSSLKFNQLQFKFTATNHSQTRAILLYTGNSHQEGDENSSAQLGPWSSKLEPFERQFPPPDFLVVLLHKGHVILRLNLGHG
ncbi:Protein eyes shut [Halotydeus destructor]|nr:Protein eyes shut [Halotydeus destructor]